MTSVVRGSDNFDSASRVGPQLMAIKTASGVAVDFTGIPAWAKKATVLFSSVSTNGTAYPLIQLGGAGGIEVTGYACSASNTTNAAATAATNFTAGIGLISGAASNSISGAVEFILLDSVTNTWAAFGVMALTSGSATLQSAGSKALASVLTQLRITTANGTDAFDAGYINVIYEQEINS